MSPPRASCWRWRRSIPSIRCSARRSLQRRSGCWVTSRWSGAFLPRCSAHSACLPSGGRSGGQRAALCHAGRDGPAGHQLRLVHPEPHCHARHDHGGSGMAALWQLAIAVQLPAARARWRLAAAGVLLGLALGTKWSVAPIAMLPGLPFSAYRIRDHGRRFLVQHGTRPLPGISLWEAGLWLGGAAAGGLLADLPAGLLLPQKPHRTALSRSPGTAICWSCRTASQNSIPTAVIWPDWVVNWRAVWYLYEPVDGAQRGILLIGNPFTMLAGIARAGLVHLGRAVAAAERCAGLCGALFCCAGAVAGQRTSRSSSITTICCPAAS